MTKKFTGDENGFVKQIHLVTIKWEKSEEGRYVPVEVPGSETVLEADLVLLAMGYLGPESSLLEALGVETNQRSNINADYGKFTTNIEKVFAAGDARRGQSLVVWAINEGRAAARECDKFLMGHTFLP
jgi:glutamate synthase (NADPH/NADH) small chain